MLLRSLYYYSFYIICQIITVTDLIIHGSTMQMVDGARIGSRNTGGPGPGAQVVHVAHGSPAGIFLLQIPGSVDKDNLSYLCCG